MTESYIQTAPDGAGKKLRTLEETVSEETVHTEVVALNDGAGTVVSPATEDGNLATIAANTTGLGSAAHVESGAVPGLGINTLTAGGWTTGVGYNKGSYVQYIASTAHATKKMLITWATSFFNIGTSLYYAQGILDIATGAAGSETVIIPDLFLPLCPTCVYTVPTWGQQYVATGQITIPISIAASQRIAARLAINNGNTTSTSFIHLQITLLEE